MARPSFCHRLLGIGVLASVLFGAGCRTSEGSTVTVPDVRGLTLAAGAEQMQSLGLCVQVEQGTGPDHGRVVDQQRPRPGSVVLEGSDVFLVTATVQNTEALIREIMRQNAEKSCPHTQGEPGGGG